MRYFYITIILSSLSILSACGTLVEGQTQDITLRTPGTNKGMCLIDNGVRYRIYTDQTISIMRSGHDLEMECYAPGNRERKMVVESGFNNWSAANVANAIVPGVTYDHLSKGLYEYPPTIVVDFVGVPTNGYETPNYQDRDAPNPYTQLIEDYSPSTPRIENDNTYMKRGVEKTDMGTNSNPFAKDAAASGMMIDDVKAGKATARTDTSGTSAPVSSTPAPAPVLKGGTADSLTRSANPSVFQSNQ